VNSRQDSGRYFRNKIEQYYVGNVAAFRLTLEGTCAGRGHRLTVIAASWTPMKGLEFHLASGADVTGGHLCSGWLGPRPVTSWGPLE